MAIDGSRPTVRSLSPSARAHRRAVPDQTDMHVGFAGGGAAEIAARIVGQVYSERFGQQVIIDPRPGAGGNHRQRTRRQSAAGRLHLAYLRVCIHRQPVAVFQTAIRHAKRFCAGVVVCLHREFFDRASVRARAFT